MLKSIAFFTMLFVQAALFAQTVPNGGFEVWGVTSYDNPDNWYSSNRESLPKSGTVTVTKVTGNSGSAVRMETKGTVDDPIGSYITNTPGDPIEGIGGVPYSQQPTGISGYYRYDLKGSDTALLVVIFKKNGTILSTDIFKIRGTGSQAAFTPFSFSLSLATTPDTMIIATASSNLITEEGVEPGSFLELDGLQFTGPGINQAIPGGSFDAWTNNSYDLIKSWNTFGDGIKRITDAYSGSYAISLETIGYGGGNLSPSGITSGSSGQSGPESGRPYSLQVDTLTGYYKYTAAGSDSAMVSVNLIKNGSNVWGSLKLLTPASTYTYFEIPINSSLVPDTMRIDIFSSKWPFNVSQVGSILKLDQLKLKSQPLLSVFARQVPSHHLTVYPNPSGGNTLQVMYDGTLTTPAYLVVNDLSGKEVIRVKYSDNGMVDISQLQHGYYYVYIAGVNGETIATANFIRN